MTSTLADQLAATAATTDFSGVVRVSVEGEVQAEFARGYADRSSRRPNALTTRFGVASGTKGFTALAVLSMVESGELSLDTNVRDVVGTHLPNIDPAVTLDHLLSHRSGIGDYLDEEALGDVDDHVLGDRSVHLFVEPSDYLHLLRVPPQRHPPGERFRYNNSGFMVLALVIELAAGGFRQAVEQRVLRPAGMNRSGFFRSDSLPPDVALGYLQDGRTNVFHLPVVGGGDGGIYLCLDDVSAFWAALFDGRIVSPASVRLFTEVVSDNGDEPSYGRGVWLGDGGDHVWLEGQDAGVSFMSGTRRHTGLEYAVLSNTSSGAWPLVRAILDPS